MLVKKDLEARTDIKCAVLEDLVPKDHLVRKLDAAIDLNFIYDIVKDTYCEDNGRPSIDPVVLVKIVLIQHMFGLRSMRHTIRETDVNMAYRWYLGYGFDEKVPHFSTYGKNYSRRFKETGLAEEIFNKVLEIAMDKGLIHPEQIYIDGTHVKASANKRKFTKEEVEQTAKYYQDELEKEIKEDREMHGKKPLADKKPSKKNDNCQYY